MRAVYLPHDPNASEIDICGEKIHHLLNVIRIRSGDELLLLDGQGTKTFTTVNQITKKFIKVKVNSHQLTTQGHLIDLALGIPKRDALDLCLKEATELGINKIFLLKSDFSQTKIPENERLLNVLISALEQANSPFLPSVIESSWEELPWEEYGECVVMNSQTFEGKYASGFDRPGDKKLLVVGPEGGFSQSEIERFGDKNCRNLRLPTPILRTPTAVAAGTGFLLGKLLD